MFTFCSLLILFSIWSCCHSQMYVLSELQKMWGVPIWPENPNCNSTGVVCYSSSDDIEELVLTNLFLTGPKLVLPDVLCKIQSLSKLVLAGLDLSGTIPDCLQFWNEGHLSLRDNKLSGGIPAKLFNSVSYLDLRNNLLTGVIPETTHGIDCSQTYINIANNYLSGPFPRSLFQCFYMESLNVGFNPTLSGPLYEVTGNWRNLMVNNANLSGTIPESYCNQFTEVSFLNNHFSCPLPDCCPTRWKGDCGTCSNNTKKAILSSSSTSRRDTQFRSPTIQINSVGVSKSKSTGVWRRVGDLPIHPDGGEDFEKLYDASGNRDRISIARIVSQKEGYYLYVWVNFASNTSEWKLVLSNPITDYCPWGDINTLSVDYSAGSVFLECDRGVVVVIPFLGEEPSSFFKLSPSPANDHKLSKAMQTRGGLIYVPQYYNDQYYVRTLDKANVGIHVFRPSNPSKIIQGPFTLTGHLQTPAAPLGYSWGTAVTVSDDVPGPSSTWLFVSSQDGDDPSPGPIYIYRQRTETTGTLAVRFDRMQTVVEDDPEITWYGGSVSASGDLLAVGGPNLAMGGPGPGHVVLYQYIKNEWTRVSIVEGPMIGERFGCIIGSWIALAGDRLVCGCGWNYWDQHYAPYFAVTFRYDREKSMLVEEYRLPNGEEKICPDPIPIALTSDSPFSVPVLVVGCNNATMAFIPT